MSYDLFITKFIHPFILYAVFGTLLGYILVQLLKQFPYYKNPGSRPLLYNIILIIPFVAYGIYRPYTDRCILHGHPLGSVNDWLCHAGTMVANILTPLFFLVTLMALLKAGLSIYATRKIVKRYGYSSHADFPELFSMLEGLCKKEGIKMPEVVVTADRIGRSFTMGYRSPVIVFSQGVLDELDRDEMETVLAHELGHIVRGDSLTTWITVFLRDLMFFSPIVYWVFRDMSCEKEMASDDFAVNLTQKPMAFAQALIKVWRLSPRTLFGNLLLDNFMPHPNFVSYSGILERRVTRILNNEHKQARNSFVSLLAGFVILVFSIWVIYWIC